MAMPYLTAKFNKSANIFFTTEIWGSSTKFNSHGPIFLAIWCVIKH